MMEIEENQAFGADFYLTDSDGEFSGFSSDEIDSDIEIAIDDNKGSDEDENVEDAGEEDENERRADRWIVNDRTRRHEVMNMCIHCNVHLCVDCFKPYHVDLLKNR